MSITHIIMLIIGLLVALKVGTFIYRQMQMNHLRRHPPKRVCFQVKVPPDSDKSNMKMTDAWNRIWAILPNHPRLLAPNKNVIRMALVGEGAPEGSAPTVRFLVWSPPELAEKVQLELTECYRGDAEVVQIKPDQDPFLSYLGSIRENKQFELALAEWQQRQQQATQGAAGGPSPAPAPVPLGAPVPAPAPLGAPVPLGAPAPVPQNGAPAPVEDADIVGPAPRRRPRGLF